MNSASASDVLAIDEDCDSTYVARAVISSFYWEFCVRDPTTFDCEPEENLSREIHLWFVEYVENFPENRIPPSIVDSKGDRPAAVIYLYAARRFRCRRPLLAVGVMHVFAKTRAREILRRGTFACRDLKRETGSCKMLFFSPALVARLDTAADENIDVLISALESTSTAGRRISPVAGPGNAVVDGWEFRGYCNEMARRFGLFAGRLCRGASIPKTWLFFRTFLRVPFVVGDGRKAFNDIVRCLDVDVTSTDVERHAITSLMPSHRSVLAAFAFENRDYCARLKRKYLANRAGWSNSVRVYGETVGETLTKNRARFRCFKVFAATVFRNFAERCVETFPEKARIDSPAVAEWCRGANEELRSTFSAECVFDRVDANARVIWRENADLRLYGTAAVRDEEILRAARIARLLARGISPTIDDDDDDRPPMPEYDVILIGNFGADPVVGEMRNDSTLDRRTWKYKSKAISDAPETNSSRRARRAANARLPLWAVCKNPAGPRYYTLATAPRDARGETTLDDALTYAVLPINGTGYNAEHVNPFMDISCLVLDADVRSHEQPTRDFEKAFIADSLELVRATFRRVADIEVIQYVYQSTPVKRRVPSPEPVSDDDDEFIGEDVYENYDGVANEDGIADFARASSGLYKFGFHQHVCLPNGMAMTTTAAREFIRLFNTTRHRYPKTLGASVNDNAETTGGSVYDANIYRPSSSGHLLRGPGQTKSDSSSILVLVARTDSESLDAPVPPWSRYVHASHPDRSNGKPLTTGRLIEKLEGVQHIDDLSYIRGCERDALEMCVTTRSTSDRVVIEKAVNETCVIFDPTTVGVDPAALTTFVNDMWSANRENVATSMVTDGYSSANVDDVRSRSRFVATSNGRLNLVVGDKKYLPFCLNRSHSGSKGVSTEAWLTHGGGKTLYFAVISRCFKATCQRRFVRRCLMKFGHPFLTDRLRTAFYEAIERIAGDSATNYERAGLDGPVFANDPTDGDRFRAEARRSIRVRATFVDSSPDRGAEIIAFDTRTGTVIAVIPAAPTPFVEPPRKLQKRHRSGGIVDVRRRPMDTDVYNEPERIPACVYYASRSSDVLESVRSAISSAAYEALVNVYRD